MTAIHIIFYAFAIVAVFSAFMVVASSNPVRGALFLVLTFFAMSGIWLLLQAEFLAIILVLVYVGAVMTLFLFVVMMLKIDVISMFEGFVRYLPLALITVLAVSGISIMVVGPSQFGLSQMPAPALKPHDFNNLNELGMLLYTDYVYAFEIAAVMLLTAIVAAISLSHRKPKHRKSQNPGEQIAIDPKNRIRLVNMKSEPKNNPLKTVQ